MQLVDTWLWQKIILKIVKNTNASLNNHHVKSLYSYVLLAQDAFYFVNIATA